jgi:transposase
VFPAALKSANLLGMTQFIPFSRGQAFLLPPDAKEWLPADGVAHFVAEAVERVPLGAFALRPIPGGRAQYHPRLMLALLIYCYANGIFSSRRIIPNPAPAMRGRVPA